MEFSDEPWLCQAAIDKLDSIVSPDSYVFEWGSGGSTVWLAQRSKLVVSIEHNEDWHRKVRARLTELGLTNNVELIFVPSKSPIFQLEYITAISIWPMFSFDVAIVDGIHRFRSECVEAAMHYVEPGGCIVLDDSERAQYREGISLMQEWQAEIVAGEKVGSIPDKIVRTQTTFFRKPGGDGTE